MTVRRAFALAIVPASAIPIVAVGAAIAPSFSHRFHELTGSSPAPHVRTLQTTTTTEGTR